MANRPNEVPRSPQGVADVEAIGRTLLPIYKSLDEHTVGYLEQNPTSCTRGCSACCYQLVGTTMVESSAILTYMLERRSKYDFATLQRKIFRQIDGLKSVKNSRTAYFRLKIPCAFLDTKTKDCTIYEVRPSECRLHFAITPPAHCGETDLSKAPTHPVLLMDLSELKAVILRFAQEALAEYDLTLVMGPLPSMMTVAMSLWMRGMAGFKAQLAERVNSPAYDQTKILEQLKGESIPGLGQAAAQEVTQYYVDKLKAEKAGSK